MKKLAKILVLMLCACLLLGSAALAEETETVTIERPAADEVIARMGGKDIVWSDADYYFSLYEGYGYIDTANELDVQWWKAKAMENAVDLAILEGKAEEFGFYPLSDEAAAAVDAELEADWEAAVSNYITYYYPDLTDESTDEEKAAAKAAAEQYYAELGYTRESLKLDYYRSHALTELQEMMLKDATVTDEEIDAAYQAQVENDKAMYENDLQAYAEYESQVQYSQMLAAYGYGSALESSAYRPAGYRGVKHILLPVDEALMSAYTELQARYEEQQSAVEGEEAATEEGEEAAEPVTEEQVNAARAAILASRQDTIDEINQKINDGADFDELIATYGVDADGNASDSGMTSEPYKTNGYEVCQFSADYVPEFVEAAMSIDALGGVSAPYLSDYGIHIVKYVCDVPAGPIELTDEAREERRAELLAEKQQELYNSMMNTWRTEAAIEYTGVIPTVAEVEAAETAAAEAALAEENAAEEATSEEETPAE